MSYILDFNKKDNEYTILKAILECKGLIYSSNRVRYLLKKYNIEFSGRNHKSQIRTFLLIYFDRENASILLNKIKLDLQLTIKKTTIKNKGKI